MANKRNLKRNINYVCSELFSEAVAASMYSSKTTEEDVNALLASILVIHNDYICRVSHPEPGITHKVFYKKLIADFKKQVEELSDQVSNLE